MVLGSVLVPDLSHCWLQEHCTAQGGRAWPLPSGSGEGRKHHWESGHSSCLCLAAAQQLSTLGLALPAIPLPSWAPFPWLVFTGRDGRAPYLKGGFPFLLSTSPKAGSLILPQLPSPGPQGAWADNEESRTMMVCSASSCQPTTSLPPRAALVGSCGAQSWQGLVFAF